MKTENLPETLVAKESPGENLTGALNCFPLEHGSAN